MKKNALRCEICRPVRVFKMVGGDATRQTGGFRHGVLSVHSPSLNATWFLANSLPLLYETHISPKKFPPEKKFPCKRPGQIQESLRRAVMLHSGFPFDRHKPLVKSMRVFVELRQENAPGFIEPERLPLACR